MVNCAVHEFIDLMKAYIVGNANLERTKSKIRKKYQGCLAVLMILWGSFIIDVPAPQLNSSCYLLHTSQSILSPTAR